MDGKALRKWRESQGLSQAKLARALDVATNTVSRFERGETGSLSGVIMHRLEALMREGNVVAEGWESAGAGTPLSYRLVAQDLRNMADLLEDPGVPKEVAAERFASFILSYAKVIPKQLKYAPC